MSQRGVTGQTEAGIGSELSVFIERRLRHLWQAPARVIGVIMGPLVSIFMMGVLLGRAMQSSTPGNYIDYLFAGVACQVALAGVGPTAIAVLTDRTAGLTDRLRSLPISRGTIVSGHVLGDSLVGALGLLAVTGVGLALGWRPTSPPGQVFLGFLLVLLFIIAMSGLAAALGVCFTRAESVSAITPFIVIMLPFLSSAFFTPEAVPEFLAPVIEWNPLSFVASACRELWGNSIGISGSVLQTTVSAIAFCAVVLAVSGLVISRQFGKESS